MLISLLFHRTGTGKYATEKSVLLDHLSFLADHYPIVLPGQKIPINKLSICITFDDAFFDFFHCIYPHLLKKKISAVLAVPAGFIADKCSLDVKSRLQMQKDLPLPYLAPYEGLCSWEEIKQMHSSNLVHVASHGFSHVPLTYPDIDLDLEIFHSKTIIEKHIQSPISSFVYPMGRFNISVHKEVKKHYQTIFRIGSAMNYSWTNLNQMAYRIPADHMEELSPIFSMSNRSRFFLSMLSNALRGK